MFAKKKIFPNLVFAVKVKKKWRKKNNGGKKMKNKLKFHVVVALCVIFLLVVTSSSWIDKFLWYSNNIRNTVSQNIDFFF